MACKSSGGEESGEPAKRKSDAEPGHPRKGVVQFSDVLLTDWQKAVLSNNERLEILLTICEGRTTPKKIAEILGKSLRRVRYHVGILAKRDLVEEDPSGQHVDPGARFYRAAIHA